MISTNKQLICLAMSFACAFSGAAIEEARAEAPAGMENQNEATLSRRVSLGAGKTIVVDLPRDVSEIVVGEWPRDLASGASLSGWQNESYWNFGCAEQATLAAQIADPRDLLSPRGQTPSDIEMRMRGIDKLRNGDDPSTNWCLMGTAISKVGSGG